MLLCTSTSIYCAYQVIAFDDLRTDYKNPIDLCNTLNPVSITIFIFFKLMVKSNLNLQRISIRFPVNLALI